MNDEREFTREEERWKAVEGRDCRADGAFVYAVRTTGVYCRPVCSSRRPKRKNVVFFETSAQAEERGFRPCLKCRPHQPPTNLVPERILQACRLIESAEEPPSLEELACVAGLSPSYFHRLFKKTLGVTPKAYASARRAERFREGLRETQTVTEAMYEAGYGASSRCYEEVGGTLGMTPTQYKESGAGQMIEFAVVECCLGWLAVAATERGICSIAFGDDPDELREEMSTQFANADLREDGSEFSEWVERVVRFVDNPAGKLELPLDIQGTAFQRRVWEALMKIPAGATSTYSEIAERLGKPTAVRAVARACATNKIAVAIPCHRVVRKDGNLSGYRWGVERKHKLLEREKRRKKRSLGT